RRKDPAVLHDLALREHADPATAAVLEAGKHPWGLPEAALADRLALPVVKLNEVMGMLAERGAVRRLAHSWLTRDRWETQVARVTGVLRAYHLAHPLRRGIPREELRSRSGIPADLYGAALTALIEDGVVTERGAAVAAARDLLGSSRRYVLPLLEWLDAQKITRRVGDDRILRA